MFRTVLASSWQMSLEHACTLKILCYHALPVSSSHASNPPAPTAPGKNHHFTKGPRRLHRPMATQPTPPSHRPRFPMFCTECGSKLKKGKVFCTKCGAKSGDAAAPRCRGRLPAGCPDTRPDLWQAPQAHSQAPQAGGGLATSDDTGAHIHGRARRRYEASSAPRRRGT